MKKTNKLDVWMISRVSVFLGQSLTTTREETAHWLLDDESQLFINFDTLEFKFIDWVGDDKTYYSIVGVAMMGGFITGDYFTEK